MRLSADCDPSVAANADRIASELRREEMAFVSTLKRGEKVLQDLLETAQAKSKSTTTTTTTTTTNNNNNNNTKPTLSGADAFLLYDTFGFPLECTQEVAAERGVDVDTDGFSAAMAAQRARGQVHIIYIYNSEAWRSSLMLTS